MYIWQSYLSNLGTASAGIPEQPALAAFFMFPLMHAASIPATCWAKAPLLNPSYPGYARTSFDSLMSTALQGLACPILFYLQDKLRTTQNTY